MPDTCPQCELPNTTLQWLETAGGFRCVGCATARRAEQTRIEAQYLKKNPIKSVK
jgi:Zn ribbon nucleic-acid-binding protein